MSTSLRLVDFLVRIVDFIHHLPKHVQLNFSDFSFADEVTPLRKTSALVYNHLMVLTCPKDKLENPSSLHPDGHLSVTGVRI